MTSHERPFVRRERAGLAQHRLRNSDLADVVQKAGARDDLDLRRREAEREREPPARGTDTLRMTARVDVLGLERVGQAQKGLIDPALQLLIERADVLGVSQRLLIRRVESAVGVAEVVAENRAYRGCHSAAPGTSVSTSVSRRIGENGLVRYSVAPASKPRRISSGRGCPPGAQ